MIRKLEDQDVLFPLLTPVHLNPDFPPGLADQAFSLWFSRGIKTVGDSLTEGTVLSFDQLREKYNLPLNNFFRYLQIRTFFFSNTKLHPNGFSTMCGMGFGQTLQVAYLPTKPGRCNLGSYTGSKSHRWNFVINVRFLKVHIFTVYLNAPLLMTSGSTYVRKLMLYSRTN